MSTGTGSGKVRVAYVLVVIALLVGAAAIAITFGGQSKPSSQIRVESLWSDQVDAPPNEVVYVLSLNVSNSGTTSLSFNPGSLRLISNVSRAYTIYNSYNTTSIMSESSVQPGSQAKGQVPFLLPADESPSKLQYGNQSAGANIGITPIPRVSAVAYRFNMNAAITANNIPVASGGWTQSECPTTTVNGTGPWICSLILNGVVLNTLTDFSCPFPGGEDCVYSVVLFTGQVVEVNLWCEYLKKPADPQTVTLQSVAAGNGFQLLNVTGTLPLSLSGTALYNPNGQGGVDVYLRVLSGNHDGRINVSEWFSA